MRKKYIKGYGKKYQICIDGTVISCGYGNTKEHKALKPRIGVTGYWVVDLCKNGEKHQRKVHRLIAQAFIKNPYKKPMINHKNGKRLDNSINNLEWCTHSENMLHAFRVLKARSGWIGKKGALHCKSVKVYQRKLDGEIIKKHAGLAEAERCTGVAQQNISKVVRGIRNHAGGFKWSYA